MAAKYVNVHIRDS